MAEKEGWSKDKVFELLRDPTKLAKAVETVSARYFDKIILLINDLHIDLHTISNLFKKPILLAK